MSAAWNRECPFEYVTVTLTPLEGMTMIGYFCRQDFHFIRQVVFVVMSHGSRHYEGVICI